jgi:hypothetical protein
VNGITFAVIRPNNITPHEKAAANFSSTSRINRGSIEKTEKSYRSTKKGRRTSN